VLVLLAMAGYLVVRRSLDGVAEAAAAIAVAGGAAGLALATGSTPADLGLSVRRLRSGAAWGAGPSALAAVVLCIASVLPVSDALFEDDRYADLEGSQLAFEVLVRIPLATAVFEELLFRGVLLALLLRDRRPLYAVAASSVAFGLWHVFSASAFAEANQGSGSVAGALVVVPVTIAVTAAAGAVLAWLRLRSGSILAPVLVHATVNAAALLLAAT